MTPRLYRMACACLLVGAAGCTDFGARQTAAPRRPTLRFESEIQPIFSTHCATSGCHAPPVNEGLDLRSGLAFDNIVGVPSTQRPGLRRIHPAEPDSSYLLHKLSDCACFLGNRMPNGRPPLPAATLQLLHDWTAAGAPR